MKAVDASRCAGGPARRYHRLSRYGVDYPEETYFDRGRPILEVIRRLMAEHLRDGHDAVVDHGLRHRTVREARKTGGRARGSLVYQLAECENSSVGCRARNVRDAANAPTVTQDALNDFYVLDLPANGREGADLHRRSQQCPAVTSSMSGRATPCVRRIPNVGTAIR